MDEKLSLIDDPAVPPYRRLYAEDVAKAFNCEVPSLYKKVGKDLPRPAYFEGKRKVWLVGQIRDWLLALGREANEQEGRKTVYTESQLLDAVFRTATSKGV